ncbi:C2 family cysteine protease [Myxococcus landrumensis]|uniref:Calpain catalytic domain-containing protein n=1 Tax=Myxococcus landrumensis TaxID=2813577 RepID=A0ABX7NJ54_9BACT|nr:C2 family cysteine protease [Myxococcus landrumus]QSQ17509.1 hypothetical protein JY572_16340 [Myxococcus landrumus]
MNDPKLTDAGSNPRFKQMQQGTYKEFAKFQLYGKNDSVKPKHVIQGSIGDCHVHSSIAAVANGDPDAIKSRITPSEDGKSFKVRLDTVDPQTGAHKDEEVTVHAHEVQVDAQFPEELEANPKSTGLLANKKNIIWPLVLEKAYVKLNDARRTDAAIQKNTSPSMITGYEAIEGGFGNLALEALTGRPTGDYQIKNKPDDELFAMLSRANNKDTPVVAGTYPLGGGHTESPATLKEKAFSTKGSSVERGHAYTVMGTHTASNGTKMVTLRNPHGENSRLDGAIHHQKGIVELPLDRFKEKFEMLTYVK